jgi:hypothetical protein
MDRHDLAGLRAFKSHAAKLQAVLDFLPPAQIRHGESRAAVKTESSAGGSGDSGRREERAKEKSGD